MKIGVSGCPNQCGETNFRTSAWSAAPRAGASTWAATAGRRPASAANSPSELSTEEVLPLVDKIVEYYRANAKPKERLGKTIERLGLDHLAAAVGVTMSDARPDAAE